MTRKEFEYPEVVRFEKIEIEANKICNTVTKEEAKGIRDKARKDSSSLKKFISETMATDEKYYDLDKKLERDCILWNMVYNKVA